MAIRMRESSARVDDPGRYQPSLAVAPICLTVNFFMAGTHTHMHTTPRSGFSHQSPSHYPPCSAFFLLWAANICKMPIADAGALAGFMTNAAQLKKRGPRNDRAQGQFARRFGSRVTPRAQMWWSTHKDLKSVNCGTTVHIATQPARIWWERVGRRRNAWRPPATHKWAV
ncbi:hypothetical protein BS50DRAFT_236914 [Corynespora cassiicola Philippines]|uniref:Uncharacterized protein n=1 Tax=Corynespora cassiicola Philippines TaxID=1448308 RepID=A0A2T2P3E6_CORCC|nr:hypothetical protein BS50DRAFT_236914 [Corynespora cassiicola Philippines]